MKEKIARGLNDRLRDEIVDVSLDIDMSRDEGRSADDSQEVHRSTSSLYKFSLARDIGTSSGSIGYLIPLDCGHNGLFSQADWQVLEFHLKRSQFILN